jgi:hypothetical protein
MANAVQLGNTTTLTLTTVTNSVTGAAVTDATVTVQPYTGAGTAVGDPITLSHVSAGTYRGYLTAAVIDANYAANAPYRLKFSFYSGTSYGEENLRGYVRERGGS